MLCLVAHLCPTLNPMDCSPPGSCVRGDSTGKNTGVGCHGLLQGIFPTQGSNPGVHHCRWIPPGKPKNTGVSILSLLQGILQNQEPTQAFLNRRQIFYPLSYQGSPFVSPVQVCILNSSHFSSSMFTICSRLYLLCFFLCYFIFFVHAYLCVCVFCLVFWKTWIAS